MVKPLTVEWEAMGSDPEWGSFFQMIIEISFFVDLTWSFKFKCSRCHAAACCY